MQTASPMQTAIKPSYKLAKLSALIAIALAASLAATQARTADDKPADEKAAQQQLNLLQQSIGKVQDWLNQAKDQRGKLETELRLNEVGIGKVVKSIKQLNLDVENANATLAELKAQQQSLQDKKDRQAHHLAQQIRAAYSAGQQQYLKVLLNQDDPGQLSRIMHYYAYLNRARQQQMDGYRDTMLALASNAEAIGKKQQSLAAARAELEQKRTTLAANRTQRQQILARLDTSIKDKDSELKQLLSNRQQLERVLEEVKKAVAGAALPGPGIPLQQLKGRLPWPSNGRVARSFGSLDTDSNSRWNGILIRANEGDNVRAVHHGRVVFSDWLRGFGLLIILDHGGGYMSLYGQNQVLYKEIGEQVAAGEVIAAIGDSGGSNQAGLYFEIRKDGKPENPQQWLSKR